MISKTRSIFYIEEEKDDVNSGVFAVETDAVFGLQIITKHGAIDSNVLTKSSMKKKKSALKNISTDFLKSCFLCCNELSPQKEVYMYRGNQGFCSVECRHNQVLQDERNKFDSTRWLRYMKQTNFLHERSTIQESSMRSKISVAA